MATTAVKRFFWTAWFASITYDGVINRQKTFGPGVSSSASQFLDHAIRTITRGPACTSSRPPCLFLRSTCIRRETRRRQAWVPKKLANSLFRAKKTGPKKPLEAPSRKKEKSQRFARGRLGISEPKNRHLLVDPVRSLKQEPKFCRARMNCRTKRLTCPLRPPCLSALPCEGRQFSYRKRGNSSEPRVFKSEHLDFPHPSSNQQRDPTRYSLPKQQQQCTATP